MLRRSLLVFLLCAGCGAGPVPVALDATHPASPDAPEAPAPTLRALTAPVDVPAPSTAEGHHHAH